MWRERLQQESMEAKAKSYDVSKCLRENGLLAARQKWVESIQ